MGDLTERLEAHVLLERQAGAHATNRASSLGHPCLRYLTFCRIQAPPLPDLGLQTIFDEGKLHERATVQALLAAGVEVTQEQTTFSWPEHQITGHIEGYLRHPALNGGKRFLWEHKTCSRFQWEKIGGPEDMAKGDWIRQGWLGQATLYMLLSNEERCLFAIKNRDTGRFKDFWVPLDLELGEALLQKADAVNRHLADGTLPEPVPWDDRLCGRCNYLADCQPVMMPPEALVLDDGELEGMLDRRELLAAAKAEYEELDRAVKAAVREMPEVVAGEWVITGKWQERDGYTAQGSRWWQTTIRRKEAKQ